MIRSAALLRPACSTRISECAVAIKHAHTTGHAHPLSAFMRICSVSAGAENTDRVRLVPRLRDKDLSFRDPGVARWLFKLILSACTPQNSPLPERSACEALWRFGQDGSSRGPRYSPVPWTETSCCAFGAWSRYGVRLVAILASRAAPRQTSRCGIILSSVSATGRSPPAGSITLWGSLGSG